MTRKKRKTRTRQERRRVFLRGIEGERKAWARRGVRIFMYKGRAQLEALAMHPQQVAFWGRGISELLEYGGGK